MIVLHVLLISVISACLLIVLDDCAGLSTTMFLVIIVLGRFMPVCMQYGVTRNVEWVLLCFQRQNILNTGALGFYVLTCVRNRCLKFGL